MFKELVNIPKNEILIADIVFTLIVTLFTLNSLQIVMHIMISIFFKKSTKD